MTEEQKKQLEQLRNDYLQTFNTDAGQRVLEDLQKRFFWNNTTFPFPTGTTEQCLINEGGRRVLLTIQSMMELPIEEILLKEEEEV